MRFAGAFLLGFLATTGCAFLGADYNRGAIADEHPEWPENFRKAIRKGFALPGMTVEQVNAAYWGIVPDASTTQTETSTSMTYIYQEQVGYGAYARFNTRVVRFEPRKMANGKIEFVAVSITD